MHGNGMTRRGLVKLGSCAAAATFLMKEGIAAAGDGVAAGRGMAGGSSQSAFEELFACVSRIYEVTEAPPLPPAEYRILFGHMAALSLAGDGEQRRAALHEVTQAEGVLKREDVDFVFDALDGGRAEWLANVTSGLLATRYRAFLCARYREAGIAMPETERDVINAWFEI